MQYAGGADDSCAYDSGSDTADCTSHCADPASDVDMDVDVDTDSTNGGAGCDVRPVRYGHWVRIYDHERDAWLSLCEKDCGSARWERCLQDASVFTVSPKPEDEGVVEGRRLYECDPVLLGLVDSCEDQVTFYVGTHESRVVASLYSDKTVCATWRRPLVCCPDGTPSIMNESTELYMREKHCEPPNKSFERCQKRYIRKWLKKNIRIR